MDSFAATPAVACGMGLQNEPNCASRNRERDGSAGPSDQAGAVIVVVDQFQELFHALPTKAERQEFLDRLLNLGRQRAW